MTAAKAVTAHYKHPKGGRITLSGKPGDDAKSYQEKQVKKEIDKIK